MLIAALLEGYLGYSLVDDLLSGMGLAIGYAVAMSIPFVGANLAQLVWGGPFPGSARLRVAHVHRARPDPAGADRDADRAAPRARRVAAPHAVPAAAGRPSRRWSACRPSPARRRARSGCCSPSPRCSSCSAASSRSTRSGCGARTTSSQATNGAQPDWYLGWLIGALRLMPGFDVTIGHYTRRAEPVLGRSRVPVARLSASCSPGRRSSAARRATTASTICSTGRVTRPGAPRSASPSSPGSSSSSSPAAADRLLVLFNLSYQGQIWAYRVLVWVLPVVALFVTRLICNELVRGEHVERRRKVAEAEPVV